VKAPRDPNQNQNPVILLVGLHFARLNSIRIWRQLHELTAKFVKLPLYGSDTHSVWKSVYLHRGRPNDQDLLI